MVEDVITRARNRALENSVDQRRMRDQNHELDEEENAWGGADHNTLELGPSKAKL